MKSMNFADRLQTFGIVAAVIGLAFVFMELRQNEKLLRVQVVNDYFAMVVSLEADISLATAQAWQKSLEAPSDLTIADMRLLDSHTYAPVMRWASLYRIYMAGLADESIWKAQVDLDASFFFNTPYSRAWWEQYSASMSTSDLPLEMKVYIDQVLADQPVNKTLKEYEAIRKRAAELHEALTAKVKAGQTP